MKHVKITNTETGEVEISEVFPLTSALLAALSAAIDAGDDLTEVVKAHTVETVEAEDKPEEAEDKPEEGKVYRLTGSNAPSIASGNTWAESVVP